MHAFNNSTTQSEGISCYANAMDTQANVSRPLISINGSAATCVRPGAMSTVPVLFTVPPFLTSLLELGVKLDVNDSACMTMNDIRLMGTGRNLHGLGVDFDSVCSSLSTQNSTQMDRSSCNFGVVTNTGVVLF